MTIRYASGDVYTVLYIWIEVERGDLGWRWRLLAPHCQQNPVQTFQIGSAGLCHPTSTYLSISCHLPSRTPAILLLPDYSALQNMLFSLPGMPYYVFFTLLLILQGSTHTSHLPKASCLMLGPPWPYTQRAPYLVYLCSDPCLPHWANSSCTSGWGLVDLKAYQIP